MKQSTIMSRLSESLGIMKESFSSIWLPYLLIVAIIQIPSVFFQQEYIIWAQTSLLWFWIGMIIIMMIGMIAVLAYSKCLIETYLMKRGNMSFWAGVRYVLIQFKGLSYVYWRMFVRIFPALMLSALIMIVCIWVAVATSQDYNSNLIFIFTVLSCIPYIKRVLHVIFMSSHALWHDDYTLTGTQVSEKSTRGVFWSILWNYGFALAIPMILGGIIGWLSSNSILFPTTTVAGIAILNLIIGLIAVIYLLVYYRDMILPRESREQPLQSVK